MAVDEASEAEAGAPHILVGSDGGRAAHELVTSEARYRLLVEQVPALVYIESNDIHRTSLYVSPQATRMLGHPPERFVADPDFWWRLMHPEDRERVEAGWETSVRTGMPFHGEYRYVRPGGDEVWVIDDARLLRADDGTPLCWQGVIQDITEGKRAEEQLRASGDRFRALVERTPGVVYETDLDDERRTLYVSPQVEAIFGYSREEWLGQPDIWIELLHPDDRELVLAAHDLHNETGEPWSQEYRLIASDGRTVWVRDQAVLVRGGWGRTATWQGIMLDITAQKELEEQLRLMNDGLELRVEERTAALAEANEMMSLEIAERKRAEAELRETRERDRRLLEDLSAVVFIWHIGDTGGEGSLSYTSPQIEQLLGFTPEEWNSPTLWIERLHPHDRHRVLAAAAKSEVTGEPFDQEYRYLARGGHVVWVHSHASLLRRADDERPLLFEGVLVDITERKEAERKAAEAEERLRAIADSGPVVNYMYELHREPERSIRFVYMSPQLSELLGRPARRTIAATLEELLTSTHPDDRERAMAELEEQWRTGADCKRELRIIAADGRIVWVRTRSRCIARDEQGRPFRFQSVLFDVTEEKAEQDRLRRSLATLSSLVHGMPGIPWTKVVDGEADERRFDYVGPQVERVLGYTPAEMTAEVGTFRRILHPGDRARVLADAHERDRSGEPWIHEFRVIARDGRVVWLRTVANVSRDERGRMVRHGIWFDITAEKERQAGDVAIVADAAMLRP